MRHFLSRSTFAPRLPRRLLGVLLGALVLLVALSLVYPPVQAAVSVRSARLSVGQASSAQAPASGVTIPQLPPCPPDESNERRSAPAGPVGPAPAAGSLAAPTLALARSSDTGDSDHDLLTGNSTPTFEGQAPAGSTVTLFNNGVLTGVATANPAGKWSYMLNECQGLPDGTHAFTAQALDAAGNVSPLSASLSVTIDSDPPAMPVITSPAANAHARGGRVDLAGTAAPGTTIRVLEGNAQRARVRADARGAWSVTLTGIAAGRHSFRASAVDAAGNESPAFNARDVLVDPQASLVPGGSNLASRLSPLLASFGFGFNYNVASLGLAQVAAASGTTVSFQNGVAPSASYAGSSDTYINQANPTTNYNSAQSCRADGDDPAGSGLDLSCLVRWDVSSIPQGSTVIAVTVTVNIINDSVNSYPIYQVLKPWNAAQATWNAYASGSPWSVPGALGNSDRGTTPLGTLDASATGLRTFALNSAGVSVVQSWVDNPSTNQGLIIADSSMTDGAHFNTSEVSTPSQRPMLTIQYAAASPATATPTATQAATDTPAPTATATAVSTDTPAATATSAPTSAATNTTAPTATATAVSTDTPAPTSTSAPTSAATPAPTATQAPAATATSAPTSAATSATTAGPVIALAGGDIACGPLGGGSCQQQATANLLTANNPTLVLPLGDNQYECGSLSDFQNYYGPSWGALKSRSYPAVGNHEYQVDTTVGQPCYGATPGAPGYYTYFGSAASPNQLGCTSGCSGYYSYDAGKWHIVVLNSVCSQAGGCGLGSAQETWLKNDLAAHPSQCTLAYWHYPRYTSGLSGTTFVTSLKAFWQDLYNAGADIILTGHDHDYERFAPMNVNGNLDTTHGIRQYVVGTGGKSHQSFGTIAANSEVRNSTAFGTLKLTLNDGSYSWQFLPVSGQTFTDSGTEACR